MTKFLTCFCKDEDGAVTVDWVVLTAAIVGLGIAIIAVIGQGAMDKSTGLGAYLSSSSANTY